MLIFRAKMEEVCGKEGWQLAQRLRKMAFGFHDITTLCHKTRNDLMRVVIVEDEPLLQQRIARFTQEILGTELTRLTPFESLEEAEDFLAQNEIDLLLLDLNLHGQNGFELLKRQVAAAFHTIVISAYAEKAIDAFEFGVLDFIAKPCSKERLAKALHRLTDNALRSHYGCRYLSVKKAAAIELIAVQDITHIQADGHYTQLFLKESGVSVLHSKSIEKIMTLLPAQFERVHRSYIVNMNYVTRLVVESGSRYQAQLQDDTLVPIGRSKYPQLKNRL